MADEDFGYGQQDPTDSASHYNERDFAIEQKLNQVSTSKIVQVLAVDATAKTVDVQIMVNQIDGNANATPHGTIFAVPYGWIQAGKNAIKMTPVVGDKGTMVVCDRDISAVLSTKKIANPGSFRTHSSADGVFQLGLPGINDDAEQFIEFLPGGGMNWQDKFGNTIVSNNSGVLINGVLFNRQSQVQGNLQVTGSLQIDGTIQSLAGGGYAQNITTSGEIMAGTIGLKSHHHTAQGALAATTISQP